MARSTINVTFDFAEIAAGGTLELFMGDKPNTEWGVLSNI